MLNDISIHDSANQLPPASFESIERLVHNALGSVFPAVTLVAVRDGQVVLHRAWGWVDPETQQQPAQTGTLYRELKAAPEFNRPWAWEDVDPAAFDALVERRLGLLLAGRGDGDAHEHDLLPEGAIDQRHVRHPGRTTWRHLPRFRTEGADEPWLKSARPGRRRPPRRAGSRPESGRETA